MEVSWETTFEKLFKQRDPLEKSMRIDGLGRGKSNMLELHARESFQAILFVHRIERRLPSTKHKCKIKDKEYIVFSC